MRSLTCLVALGLAACPSNKVVPMVDAPIPTADAPPGACPGAVYDPCTVAGSCMSMDCHFYNGAGFTVCTTACSATVPCPNDISGNPGFCNNMGNCKPSAPNMCTAD